MFQLFYLSFEVALLASLAQFFVDGKEEVENEVVVIVRIFKINGKLIVQVYRDFMNQLNLATTDSKFVGFGLQEKIIFV
jgi:hypothetical protein